MAELILYLVWEAIIEIVLKGAIVTSVTCSHP